MSMNSNGVPGGNYAQAPDAAFPGMRADSRIAFNTESAASCEPGTIQFGMGVVLGDEPGTVRLPRLNQSVATMSGAFGASNSIVVTVNGEATTATVYADSDAATKAAVLVKVLDLPGVVSASWNANALTVRTKDADATVTVVVTGGSAVTATYATSSVDVLAGLAEYQAGEGTLPTPEQPSQGIGIQFCDTVGRMTQGTLWVPLADGVTVTAVGPAYVVTAAGADRGKLTTVSTGNIRCGTFRPDMTAEAPVIPEGCAEVELINPRVAA